MEPAGREMKNHSFAVTKGISPYEEKWCFCFGESRTVVGVGRKNQRWWDSKQELIDALSSLGIRCDEYEEIGTT
jgi:hypothetical protein